MPTMIPLHRLHTRPDNANRMPAASFRTLVSHIRRTGQYPQIIVRPLRSPRGREEQVDEYEILDGHHRVQALKEIGEIAARCDVWKNIDDAESLVLLTTLNRLQGHDDPLLRGVLVEELVKQFGRDRTIRLLPEDGKAIDRLLELQSPPEMPTDPGDVVNAIPEAVTFFLSHEQKCALDARLRTVRLSELDDSPKRHSTRSERLIALLHLEAESDSDPHHASQTELQHSHHWIRP